MWSGSAHSLYWMGYGDRDGPRPRVTWAQLRRVFSYLRPYVGKTILVLLCIAAGSLASIAQNLATVVFTLVTIFALSWQLGLLALVVVPTIVLPLRRVGAF